MEDIGKKAKELYDAVEREIRKLSLIKGSLAILMNGEITDRDWLNPDRVEETYKSKVKNLKEELNKTARRMSVRDILDQYNFRRLKNKPTLVERIVEVLYEKGKPMTSKEIAEELGLTGSSRYGVTSVYHAAVMQTAGKFFFTNYKGKIGLKVWSLRKNPEWLGAFENTLRKKMEDER